MSNSFHPHPDTTPLDVAGHRFGTALVLAGAGAAGNAWQLGLIAGLAERGVDLTRADLVVGTSAGATVAAQITSGIRPAELFAAILHEPPRPTGVVLPSDRGRGHLSGPDYLEWSDAIIRSAHDADDLRRRFAAAALARDPAVEPTVEPGGGAAATPVPNRWRDIVASRLPADRWPEQRVLITAVDARTGDPVVFDRDSGVELVDAVAASTSNGFGGAYRIGENRYLNGGYRRSSNADLAAGYRRVLVLDPFSGRSRTPREWGLDLATQVDELRAGGSAVETVFPDARSGNVFDSGALDPSTRLPAAKGGHEQGRDLADHLAPFWRGDS